MTDFQQRAKRGTVLELGAGESPYPDADVTVDIRENLDGIDYGGVDIGNDPLPVDDGSFDIVVMFQVLEHVAPNRIGHLFRECDRVLHPGGAVARQAPARGHDIRPHRPHTPGERWHDTGRAPVF